MTPDAESSPTETPSRPTLAVEGGTHTRLLLQRRGPDAARRHLARDILRFFSLAALDSGAFLGLRAVLRLLRDDSFAGPAVADALRVVFPRGILGGTEFVLALVIGLFLTGAYGRGDSRRDAGRVVRGVAVAVTLALWTTFWRGDTSLVLLQASVMVLTFWAGLMIGRLAFEALVRLVFNIPAEGQPIVFVGDRDDVDAQRIHGLLRGQAEARRTTSWVNVRTAPDGAPLEAPERTVDRLHGSISAVNAHTVVLCGDFAKPTFEAVVEAASSAGLRVLSAARLSGVMERRTGMVWYSGAPFVELTVPGFKSWQLIVKRAVDFAAAGVGLVLLSPLFAVIAAAIRRDSEGPVFFSQERVGYAGVVFRVHKFRTMRVTAEAEKGTMAHLNASGDQRLFKIPSDPRVTQLGALLRRWSLDELPQLFNVLSGEMSLVGPRPFFEADLKDYLDHHYSRLGAKPGITGLWQVTGRSAVLDFEEVVRLDREYIERWSVWLDLSILLRTIPAVFRGRGAY